MFLNESHTFPLKVGHELTHDIPRFLIVSQSLEDPERDEVRVPFEIHTHPDSLILSDREFTEAVNLASGEIYTLVFGERVFEYFGKYPFFTEFFNDFVKESPVGPLRFLRFLRSLFESYVGPEIATSRAHETVGCVHQHPRFIIAFWTYHSFTSSASTVRKRVPRHA